MKNFIEIICVEEREQTCKQEHQQLQEQVKRREGN